MLGLKYRCSWPSSLHTLLAVHNVGRAPLLAVELASSLLQQSAVCDATRLAPHAPFPALLDCADMAKPKPLTDLDSTATSPPCYSNSLRRTSRHHKPSSSKRQSYSPYSGPSSSLLALLATVAASSSSVDGRPLAADSQPLDFLCPLLPIDISEDPSLSPSKRSFRGDEVDEDYFILKPTPTRARRAIKRRALVADKYIQGDDGQWRKEHSWTLYGSTYCEVSIH